MFEITNLFIYKFIFVGELLISNLIFTFKFNKRNHFVSRLLLTIVINSLVAFLFPIFEFSYTAVYTSFMFILMFFICTSTLLILYKESYTKILFFGVAAYTLQHIAYQGYTVTLAIIGINESPINLYGETTFTFSAFFANPLSFVVYVFMYFIVYTAGYLFFARTVDYINFKIKNITLFVVLFITFIVDVFGNAFNNEFATTYLEDNNVFKIVTGLVNFVYAIFVLIMQYQLIDKQHLKDELELIKQLRSIEKEQFKLKKETIDLINIKCHDIKHQISLIGENRSISKEYIRELENAVKIYDLAFETGNDTLDILLKEYSLRILKNNITITCISDGKKLDFLSETDIYSLFGNIIDNAIEAVTDLEDDKKTISLLITESNGVITITERNYFKNNITLEENNLLSTKKDPKYHGFGLKSIKYVVDKYNGETLIEAHNNIYSIIITFKRR